MIKLLPLLLLTGCAQKPDLHGSWFSVEKPPIKIVYINRDDVVSPEVAYRLTRMASQVPYKDYKFNENANVSLTATGVQDIAVSNSTELDTKSD